MIAPFSQFLRLLENLNLNEVFEALKVKAEGATPFQWRKLREVCLISKSSKEKGKENAINFIIEGNKAQPEHEDEDEI